MAQVILIRINCYVEGSRLLFLQITFAIGHQVYTMLLSNLWHIHILQTKHIESGLYSAAILLLFYWGCFSINSDTCKIFPHVITVKTL